MAIPPFEASGNLPPGIHEIEWSEFVERFGWSPRRKWLIEGLVVALRALKKVGCKTVYIDGSFATTKENPGDYDACWSDDDVDLDVLEYTAPAFFVFDDHRREQKALYRGEFFPADLVEVDSKHLFLEFFQVDREGGPKGILKLNLEMMNP